MLKKIDKNNKIMIISLIIMIIGGLLSKFFPLISKIMYYYFFLWCLYFLIWFIINVLKVSKLKFTKQEKIVIGIFLLILMGMYLYVVLNRIQLYQWDSSNYYINNLKLNDTFLNGSWFKGIKEIIRSTIKDSYGKFLLCFTTFLFSFTNQKEDLFIICYTLTIVIPAFFMLICLAKKLIEQAKLKNNLLPFILAISGILCCPLFHKSALNGQPDLIGLIFIVPIILLTIDYDFKKLDYKRFALLFLSLFCLLISRRWYMYWVLGYGISYIITFLIKNYKDKIKIKNAIIFGLLCVVIVILPLIPMFIRILKQDFSAYTSWNLGGYPREFTMQINRLGLLYVFIILIGLGYGLKNKEYRITTINAILTFIIALVAFVKTQNMGNHQSLILISSYMLGLILAVIGIFKIDKDKLQKVLICLVAFIFISNILGSLTELPIFFNNKIYSSLSLKPTKRSDYEMVGQMVDFIKENTTSKDRVYINAASPMYCSQTFSGYVHPDLSLTKIINYESSIDAAHGFPAKQFATSKYVFTTNVLVESTGAKTGHIIPAINEALNNDTVVSKKYQKVNEFVMSDTITFYAYERIKPFDEEELNYWLKVFEKQTEQYPDLFGNKIQKYWDSIK